MSSSSLRETLAHRGHGMFRSQDGVKAVAALGAEAGWKVVEFDLHDVHDKESLLDRAASAFDLPDWFGANWDAFADCLTDVVGDPGVLVVIGDNPDRTALPAQVRRTALEILDERAGRRDDPFVVVVTSAD